MPKQTAADFLLKTLVQSGVKRIYGLAGDSLNALTDAVRATPEVKWLHVRHEEVAAFAAGAEAHLTKSLTVCAGSCGPGNLHLINGLYDCHRSRVPVLAIAAHIPSAEIGTGYFQETDPAHLFKECSHYVGTVSSAENLPRILKIAIETAINKRGVAVLVMAGDVATSALDAAVQAFSLEAQSSYLRPSDAKVAELKGALEKAKKVTILAGAGCEGAHAELL
ncbi:MAG: ubiquinone-dependent pyruvate dehydrogenase, partial [Proteobacteria bacterium]